MDAGTTSCKTILFNLNGEVVASKSKDYPVHYPKPTWAEQSPEHWWRAAAESVKAIIQETGIDAESILGVGVDSQREAPVLLDRHGTTLTNSIIWLDRRTLKQAKEIEEKLPREYVVKKTGLPIDYFYTAPKILWFKEEKPRIFSKVKKILFPKDYIIFKLTGQYVTDYSMASRTMLFDINQRAWCDEICEGLEIPVEALPEVKDSWEKVGEVQESASKATGINVGTPVAGGGGDRPCEALGAAVINPGEINIGTGTGTVLTAPLEKPVVDLKGRFDCCCHVVPDRWEYEGLILTTGASLKWFRDHFCHEELKKAFEVQADPYTIMDEEAGKVPPGSEGLLYYPYPMGGKSPVFNDQAKACFYGFTLAHTKRHFIRAILEGVAYQYGATINILRELGIHVRRASLVGGESRSDLWNSIKASATGIPMTVMKVSDAAALGSAILGGLASEAFSSVSKAVRKMVKAKKTFKPGGRDRGKYRVLQEKYWRVYQEIQKGYQFIA
ncbi:MAG: xylulokinase [Candidatus Bathyarchaeia archaeon]